MKQSLLNGLTEKDVIAIVNKYDRKDFVYPQLFPLKQQIGLTWSALQFDQGLIVSADVVARDSDIDVKSREAVSKLSGETPKIAIKRQMSESALYQYRYWQSLAMGDANAVEMVGLYADDVNACLKGVDAKIEQMALAGLSRGKLSFNGENNNGVVSRYDITYDVKAKSGFKVKAWSDTATAKPIEDLKEIVKTARKNGIYLKYAFMNSDTLAKLAACAEVQKYCASYTNLLAGLSITPSITDINAALSRSVDLFGLQIVEVDQNLEVEARDGKRTAGNPFANDVVCFTESRVVGNTFWTPTIDMAYSNEAIFTANNGCTFLKKYAEEKDSVREMTLAVANAIPVWTSANRSYLMNVENDKWV